MQPPLCITHAPGCEKPTTATVLRRQLDQLPLWTAIDTLRRGLSVEQSHYAVTSRLVQSFLDHALCDDSREDILGCELLQYTERFYILLQHYLMLVWAQSQELKAFLTVEGSLADSYQWRQLQPLQGSVLEGIARLPKQLLGRAHPSSASPYPKAPSATFWLLSGPS